MSSNANPIRTEAGAVRVRKNVTNLSDEELNSLRRAFEGLYRISQEGGNDDERGYQWIAGVHGRPNPVQCIHGPITFLPWHRAYIYEFEQRLQDQVETVMLPYWDWTSDESLAGGLPAALTDDEYVDLETGDTKPNPLKSAFSQATGANTSRSPGQASELGVLKDLIEQSKLETTFADYSPANENPHGGLHVWVSGDMGSVPTAAYDPVFWMHHCNVDRFWFEWQREHGNATVPDWVRQFVCRPFAYTGEQTLDTEFFGYTYADAENFAEPTDAEPVPEAVLTPTMVFDIGEVGSGVRRAELAFVGLKKTEESYIVRVYCDAEGGYDASSAVLDNEAYGSTLYLFGHGECGGGPGHCDVRPRGRFDRRPEHHLAPVNLSLDVTRAVRNATGSGGSSIRLSFVVMDPKGQQVDPSVVEFDGVSLVTRR